MSDPLLQWHEVASLLLAVIFVAAHVVPFMPGMQGTTVLDRKVPIGGSLAHDTES